MRLPVELRDTSSRQRGVITIRELRAGGIRSRQITAALRDGHWQRATSAVVVTHPLPLDRPTRLWIAAVHFDGFMLAGSSALELSGLPAPNDDRIHLLGRRGGQSAPTSSWKLHTSSSPLTLGSSDGPPATSALSATAHAMRWATSDRQAIFIATWSLQRGFSTLDSLRASLPMRARNVEDARALRVLALLQPGVHSINEYDFGVECRRRGLPEPIRQQQRRDARGGLRFTDCEFVVGSKRLVVEIDGTQHLETKARVDDAWRANEIALQGAVVLRISSLELRTDPERFFEQLARALRTLALAA